MVPEGRSRWAAFFYSAMSAFGPKQTSAFAPHMSALRGKADMTLCGNPLLRSLLEAKRTSLLAARMSAFDPKRTSAGRFCCDAKRLLSGVVVCRSRGLRNATYDVHGRRNFPQSGRQVDLPPLARKGTHDAGWIEVREQLGDSRPRPVFPADGSGRHHVAATVDSWLVRSDGV